MSDARENLVPQNINDLAAYFCGRKIWVSEKNEVVRVSAEVQQTPMTAEEKRANEQYPDDNPYLVVIFEVDNMEGEKRTTETVYEDVINAVEWREVLIRQLEGCAELSRRDHDRARKAADTD